MCVRVCTTPTTHAMSMCATLVILIVGSAIIMRLKPLFKLSQAVAEPDETNWTEVLKVEFTDILNTFITHVRSKYYNDNTNNLSKTVYTIWLYVHLLGKSRRKILDRNWKFDGTLRTTIFKERLQVFAASYLCTANAHYAVGKAVKIF